MCYVGHACLKGRVLVRVRFATSLSLLLLLSLSVCAQQNPDDFFPAADWHVARPEQFGYSSARLDALRVWLKAGDTTAMMVVVHGQVIFEYGDIARATKVASVRKSILSMLYGKYVFPDKADKPAIDLNKTVTDLHLEEPGQPFLPIESDATLAELLQGRSGIYLLPLSSLGSPAEDLLTSSQPRRGSQFPNTYFHYNDWDFDAAGTAFTQLTGKNIYDALRDDLAIPIHMQDFDRARQQSIAHPGQRHPEYAMWLSTRDLARLGLLMLRNGEWRGAQVIPSVWIGESTSPITLWSDMNPPLLRSVGYPERWGFGMMWWAWDSSTFSGRHEYFAPFSGAFEAMGTGGQYLTVLPAEDMVIVHKVDLDGPSNELDSPTHGDVGRNAWDAILEMVIASRCDHPDACK